MDALSLLALQIAWGADEALAPEPISRLHLATADLVAAPPSAATAREPATLRSPPRAVLPGSIPPEAMLPGAMPPGRMPGMPEPATPARTALPAGKGRETAPPARGPAAAARAAAEAAADLDALRAVIAAFDQCGLRDTATRPVLPAGNPSNGVVIVGEVPDEDEDRAGQPFAGRNGELLDRMLGSIGLDRGHVLLLPLIPWRPPGGRPPNPIEMATCLPFLQRGLALARPTHILSMGSRPARVLADSVIRAGAGWRRPVLPDLPEGARVLAMRHPGYLLSHLPARREAWADLIRLRRALDQTGGETPATAP